MVGKKGKVQLKPLWARIPPSLETGRKIVFNLSGLAGILLVIGLIFPRVFSQSVYFGSFSIPSALEAKGFTEEIVQLKIQDELKRIIRETDSAKESVGVKKDNFEELETLTLPGFGGMTLTQTAQILRTVFSSPIYYISGEVVCYSRDCPNGSATFTLRFRGREGDLEEIREFQKGPEDPGLYTDIAAAILERFDPYILAYYSYYRRHDPETAEKLIKRLLANETPEDDKWAHNLYGNIYLGLGRCEAAKAQYQAALSRDKNFYYSYNNLGEAFARQGNLEKARENFQRALGINPDYARANMNMGMALMEMGESPDVFKKYFDTAFALSEDEDFEPPAQEVETAGPVRCVPEN